MNDINGFLMVLQLLLCCFVPVVFPCNNRTHVLFQSLFTCCPLCIIVVRRVHQIYGHWEKDVRLLLLKYKFLLSNFVRNIKQRKKGNVKGVKTFVSFL